MFKYGLLILALSTFGSSHTMTRAKQASLNRSLLEAVFGSKDVFGYYDCHDEPSEKVKFDLAAKALSDGANPDVRNPASWTPLIRAASSRYMKPDLPRLLLKSGADPDLAEKKFGYTPLMYAAYMKNCLLVKDLLEHEAKLDLKNKAGLTALCIARNAGCDENTTALSLALSLHNFWTGSDSLLRRVWITKVNLCSDYDQKSGTKNKSRRRAKAV